MSKTTYAIKLGDEIIPIHVIESNLIKKDIYNRRKPLRGENTSRGVIKSGSITTGTISCRLTNRTAPYLLYLVTGKETDYRHVPETRGLYQRILVSDYEQGLEFSLLEISDECCIENPGLHATGFVITQSDEKPLIMKINAATPEEPKEAIAPEIKQILSERFFYMSKLIKIQADFENESYIKIDLPEIMLEKPLLLEAYSKDEYELNRKGLFQIFIEDYKMLKQVEYSNYSYKHECFGLMKIAVYS